jgi:hypothetical protein
MYCPRALHSLRARDHVASTVKTGNMWIIYTEFPVDAKVVPEEAPTITCCLNDLCPFGAFWFLSAIFDVHFDVKHERFAIL